MPANETALHIEALSKEYQSANHKVLALENVELSIASGEFFCIVGPSGCGKSTLLNLLAGFETPSSGAVKLFSKTILHPSRDILLVMQEPALFPWLTVRQNVCFGLTLKGEKDLFRTDSLISVVGLSGFENAFPHQLSGGMKQRASLARALAMEPKVLLMDEPFAALDALTRHNMRSELVRIWSETKKTIVFITHDVEEAAFLGDRVAVMSGRPGGVGKIVPVEVPRPRRIFDERLNNICESLYNELGLGSDPDQI
jgi:NitT/TauT family transport system ATP-binding protein